MNAKPRPSPITVADEKYRPGQVWSYETRAGESGSTVTICRVDSFGNGDVTVHVWFDGVQIMLPLKEPSSTLTHAPVSREAMDRSVIRLIRDGAPIPDYEGAYKVWMDDEGSGTFSVTLAEVLDLIEITLNADSAGES